MRVIRQALEVLESTSKPGTVEHSPESWTVPVKEATQSWQPPEPSPIIRIMRPRIREILRQRRQGSSE
jgi:hypothetical protein